MRNAPKMYSTQANWCSAAPPSPMRMPRSTRASRIPSSRTRPWYWRATPELLISRTNTRRLSSDRLYSVSQPAKNWPAATPLPAVAISAPNSTASATVAPVQSAASARPSGPRRRALTKRSAPRRTARAATVAAQAQRGTWRTLMASRSLPAPHKPAMLAGPPEVVGSQHPGRGAIPGQDQRVPGRVQGGRDGRTDGQPREQLSQGLIGGGGDNPGDRGGHVREPQPVTLTRWHQRQLAEREHPRRVPLEVPQREGRRDAGRHVPRPVVEERLHRVPARDGLGGGTGAGQDVAYAQAGQGRNGLHLTGLRPARADHYQPDQPSPDTVEIAERERGHAAGEQHCPGDL